MLFISSTKKLIIKPKSLGFYFTRILFSLRLNDEIKRMVSLYAARDLLTKRVDVMPMYFIEYSKKIFDFFEVVFDFDGTLIMNKAQETVVFY